MKGGNMKAMVGITQCEEGFIAFIEIKHNLLESGLICSEIHHSKGQLKRKVIQFCGELGLEIEWI